MTTAMNHILCHPSFYIWRQFRLNRKLLHTLSVQQFTDHEESDADYSSLIDRWDSSKYRILYNLYHPVICSAASVTMQCGIALHRVLAGDLRRKHRAVRRSSIRDRTQHLTDLKKKLAQAIISAKSRDLQQVTSVARRSCLINMVRRRGIAFIFFNTLATQLAG